MKFADEELAARPERSRHLRKHRTQILDVFKHEIANDELERFILARPLFRYISDDKEHLF